MTKLTEIPENQLDKPNQSNTGLGFVETQVKDSSLKLIDDSHQKNAKKKKVLYEFRILLKFGIVKSNKSGSLQSFIDKYIFGEIINQKFDIDLNGLSYGLDPLKEAQIKHLCSFDLHRFREEFEMAEYIEKHIGVEEIEKLQSNLIDYINKLFVFLSKYSFFIAGLDDTT